MLVLIHVFIFTIQSKFSTYSFQNILNVVTSMKTLLIPSINVFCLRSKKKNLSEE